MSTFCIGYVQHIVYIALHISAFFYSSWRNCYCLMFEMLFMRAVVFLHDCQEGCSVRSCLAVFLLLLLLLSPLIEHNTAAHVSGVDWLRDEPLSRLSAITAVQGLGLTFIGPHCAIRCVTFPLSWDKPVTAGPDGQQPEHPLPPPSSFLLLCTPRSSPQTRAKPLPGHSHRSELQWGLASGQ